MIKEVVIQIAPPSRRPGDHGLVAIGRYKVEDNILTMLDYDDRPLRDRKGIIKRTLEPGEDAGGVTRRLTRDMHMRQADRFSALFITRTWDGVRVLKTRPRPE